MVASNGIHYDFHKRKPYLGLSGTSKECRWVFRLKQTTDSSSPKYKVRIIATGFREEYGVDFNEVFSLVVKVTTLQFLLGRVVLEDLELP